MSPAARASRAASGRACSTRSSGSDYHPHVTVAHEVPDDQLDAAFAGLADFDASFVVDSFHSYAHGDDGVWRPARDFSLTGPPADAGVGTST